MVTTKKEDNNNDPSTQNDLSNKDSNVDDSNQVTTSTDVKPKGHGRLGVTDYKDAEVIHFQHTTLKPGDLCPLHCGGRLYVFDPGSYIVIQGQPMARVINYQVEKLRCALCLEVFSPELPEEAKNACLNRCIPESDDI